MQKSMLIGQWKMSDLQSQHMTESMNTMSEEQKTSLESLLAETIPTYSFEFKEDGTYIYKVPMMDTEIIHTGRWDINGEGKTFTILTKEGKETGYNITESSETTMTLKNDDNTMSFVKV